MIEEFNLGIGMGLFTVGLVLLSHKEFIYSSSIFATGIIYLSIHLVYKLIFNNQSRKGEVKD